MLARFRSLALGAALLLGACATADAPPSASGGAALDPLARAFTTRLPELEASAEAGDSGAQYALAVLKQHSLRGLARNREGAAALRQAALASRGTTSITQYIPGLNGQPGRTAIINLPKAGALSGAAVRGTDACIAALMKQTDPEFGTQVRGEPGTIVQLPNPAKAVCGGEKRAAALVRLWSAAKPWGPQRLPQCNADDSRCRVLRAKVESLNRRDPVTEAAAAAARGDWRLGAFNHIGPMPQGWDTVGVSCRDWSRELIGKWHVNQDVISPGDPEHTDAALAFLTTYNRRIVTDAAFPYLDICAEEGVKPLPRHPGPVRTAAEAARSGDLAKLAALPPTVDVNARDPFETTALDWAMANGDEPMARALLERGADPNRYDEDAPSPLALALNGGRTALADLLLAKGARVPAVTGLCKRELFVDPQVETGNRKCSGAGLLIAAGRLDLLDAQARAGALDQPVEREPLAALDRLGEPSSAPARRVEMIDSSGEIWAAFQDAVRRKDEPLTARLLPYIGRGSSAAWAVGELWKLGRPDLVRALVVRGQGAEAARSPLEAELWRAAAAGGHDAALAFLQDYGADANLLTAARAATCRSAAAAGDVGALLACVREAGERRLGLQAALAAGDTAAFARLAAEAADVAERNKATLVSAAAGAGRPELLPSLLSRGARAEASGYVQGGPAPVYAGPFKAEADAQAAASGYRAALLVGEAPILRAALRGDAASVRLLADAGAPNLLGAILTAGQLTGSSTVDTFADGAQATENRPNGPSADRARAFDLLAAEIARAYGPQALESAFRHAVAFGYNDLLRTLLRRGYQPAKATLPDRIWNSWSGLWQPCKPSTGRILIESGLPYSYPVPTDFTNERPLHMLAATCVNPDSVAVLVTGPAEVNELNLEGETALDQALQRREQHLVTALRAQGGKTAAELGPAAVARRDADVRAEVDLDLEQSERR